jgi:hypothetical protein
LDFSCISFRVLELDFKTKHYMGIDIVCIVVGVVMIAIALIIGGSEKEV